MSQAASVAPAPARKLKFSDRVTLACDSPQSLVFDGRLRQAVEPDIQRCREGRDHAFRAAPVELVAALRSDAFAVGVAVERDLRYDTARYDLRMAFAEMLGVEALELERLHERFRHDTGRKGDRQEKLQLLSGMADPARRANFTDVFVRLVLERIAPSVAEDADVDTVACQSFPCVRINRPGEFSIGPHCDAQYGHGLGNINFYLPLTSIGGTNSLWLESAPGMEDWHCIDADFGAIKRFWGGACAHFTVRNHTASTRVSLDFRCVPGPIFDLQKGRDQYTDSTGYYFVCRRGVGGDWAVEGREPVGQPTKLMGFPFTDFKLRSGDQPEPVP